MVLMKYDTLTEAQKTLGPMPNLTHAQKKADINLQFSNQRC